MQFVRSVRAAACCTDVDIDFEAAFELTWKCFDSQLVPFSPTIAAVLPQTNIGLPVTNVW